PGRWGQGDAGRWTRVVPYHTSDPRREKGFSGGSPETAGELLRKELHHAGAEGAEGGDEPLCLGGQAAALGAPAADPGFDQGPAQGRLGLLDPAPDVAVALTQVGGGLLNGAGPLHGLQDLADAQAEGIAAPGFQPDLDAGDQVRRL